MDDDIKDESDEDDYDHLKNSLICISEEPEPSVEEPPIEEPSVEEPEPPLKT